MMLSGVFSSRSSGPAIIGPTIMISTDAAPVTVMQAPTALESSSRFCAPKYCDTMMLAPTEMPTNSTIIRFRMGPALPTAASALSPTKRPSMMLSTVLYNCCAMFPSSMGMAKRTIWLTGLPSRISTARNALMQ